MGVGAACCVWGWGCQGGLVGALNKAFPSLLSHDYYSLPSDFSSSYWGCLRSLPAPAHFPFEGHLGPRGSVTLNICWALGYCRNGAGLGGRQTQVSPRVSLGLNPSSGQLRPHLFCAQGSRARTALSQPGGLALTLCPHPLAGGCHPSFPPAQKITSSKKPP